MTLDFIAVLLRSSAQKNYAFFIASLSFFYSNLNCYLASSFEIYDARRWGEVKEEEKEVVFVFFKVQKALESSFELKWAAEEMRKCEKFQVERERDVFIHKVRRKVRIWVSNFKKYFKHEVWVKLLRFSYLFKFCVIQF